MLSFLLDECPSAGLHAELSSSQTAVPVSAAALFAAVVCLVRKAQNFFQNPSPQANLEPLPKSKGLWRGELKWIARQFIRCAASLSEEIQAFESPTQSIKLRAQLRPLHHNNFFPAAINFRLHLSSRTGSETCGLPARRQLSFVSWLKVSFRPFH
jgi:hypothetical protein